MAELDLENVMERLPTLRTRVEVRHGRDEDTGLMIASLVEVETEPPDDVPWDGMTEDDVEWIAYLMKAHHDAEVRRHELGPARREKVDARLEEALKGGVEWDTYPGVLDSIIDDVEAGQ